MPKKSHRAAGDVRNHFDANNMDSEILTKQKKIKAVLTEDTENTEKKSS